MILTEVTRAQQDDDAHNHPEAERKCGSRPGRSIEERQEAAHDSKEDQQAEEERDCHDAPGVARMLRRRFIIRRHALQPLQAATNLMRYCGERCREQMQCDLVIHVECVARIPLQRLLSGHGALQPKQGKFDLSPDVPLLVSCLSMSMAPAKICSGLHHLFYF